MIRFLGFVISLIIVGGLALHAGLELPGFAHWVGNLPGDMIVKRGDLTLYFPITSSVLVSFVLTFVLSLFSGK